MRYLQAVAVIYNEEDTMKRGEPGEIFAIQWNRTVVQTVCQALDLMNIPHSTIPVKDSLEELRHDLSAYSPSQNFVFNLVDEFDGEGLGEARVIEVVEQMGFKHTGASPEVIRLCTDKSMAKRLLLAHGIITPAYEVVEKPCTQTGLEYPLFVKPVREDASFGISQASVITTPKQLAERVDYILEVYRQPALIESYIPGREFAVSLWGNETVEALPLSEMDYTHISDPLRHILTYNSKWAFDSDEYRMIPLACPAVLKPIDQRRIVDAAKATYRSIGLRDFGRVDIRYHQGIPYVIDINEIPDLSNFSGFSYAAQQAGHSYAEVIRKILNLAMEREGIIALEH